MPGSVSRGYGTIRRHLFEIFFFFSFCPLTFLPFRVMTKSLFPLWPVALSRITRIQNFKIYMCTFYYAYYYHVF